MSVVGAGNALHVCNEQLFDTGNVTSIESPVQCQCELSVSVDQARLLCLFPSNDVAIGSVWTHSQRAWWAQLGNALHVCSEHLFDTGNVASMIN